MRLRRMGVALVVVAALGTGCGGDDGHEGADAVSLDEPIGASSHAGAQEGSRRGGAAVAKSAFAAMDVPKEDLDAAAQAVVDLATARNVGGFLVTSVFDTERGHGSAHVVVNVPSPTFEAVVGELRTIGDVKRQELEGQDITPEFLAAQQALQRSRARTSDLIARLEAAGDAAARFELREQLRGARARLQTARHEATSVGADVALSRVEVALRATPPPPAPGKPAVERALGTARALTLGIASGAVLVAGAIVPILALLILIYLVGGVIVRLLKPRLHGWPG